jgi:hypothetical protein
MTDDEQVRPADDGAATADTPNDGDDPGDRVPDALESAAELGLGAVIAPFTGGETVSIVGSVASMIEAGFDRLTHLGEHETPPDDAAAEPADDGPE